MENHARAERISQEGDTREDSLRDLLSEASEIARGVLESIQALAGTTTCKGVQIASLEKRARNYGCWVDNPEVLGTYSDRGSENEVLKFRTVGCVLSN